MARFGRGRPSTSSVLWVLAWVVIGSAVIASNLGGTLAVDDGTVRLKDRYGRIEVDAQYARDVKEQDVVPPVGVPHVKYAYVATLGANSTSGDRRTVRMLLTARMVAILIGACAFAEMLSLALRRRLFSAGSVVALWVIAACVAVGGIAVPLAEHRFAVSTIERLETAGSISMLSSTGANPGPAPYVIVAMVLVFAEVWRRAMRLQREVEATI